MRSGSQSELLRGLESLALDVVLTNIHPPRDASSQWLITKLAEQPVSLIGTAKRLGRKKMKLAELIAAHPLVLPTPETSLRAAFDALAATLDVAPQIAAEADDMAMLRLLTREDAGLCVIPPIVVRDELASGKLVEAMRLDGIQETFLAVTLSRRFPNPLLRSVLN